MSSRAAGSVLLRHLGPRVFGPVSPVAAPPRPLLATAGGGEGGGAVWVRVRLLSTSAAAEAKEEVAASKGNAASTAAAKAEAAEAAKDGEGKKSVVSSYWGIVPAKLAGKDGAEWRWSCFRPWETYKPDTSIDLTRHHEPKVLDKIAYWTVKLLRVPTDIFFQRRYGCRAMMLETVAAVPGMVGGMLLHLRSLRRFEHSGGWIRALLEEAENERMHLMTFMEVAKPKWYERASSSPCRASSSTLTSSVTSSPPSSRTASSATSRRRPSTPTPSTSRTSRPARSRTCPPRPLPSTTGAYPLMPRSRTSSSWCAPTRRTTATSIILLRTSITRGWSSRRRPHRWDIIELRDLVVS